MKAVWTGDDIQNLKEGVEKALAHEANSAFERAAQIAECWRCEITYDAPENIRDRIERQNKVACEIAAAIRAETRGGQ